MIVEAAFNHLARQALYRFAFRAISLGRDAAAMFVKKANSLQTFSDLQMVDKKIPLSEGCLRVEFRQLLRGFVSIQLFRNHARREASLVRKFPRTFCSNLARTI